MFFKVWCPLRAFVQWLVETMYIPRCLSALFDHMSFAYSVQIKSTSIVFLKQMVLLMNTGALDYIVNIIRYLAQMESRIQWSITLSTQKIFLVSLSYTYDWLVDLKICQSRLFSPHLQTVCCLTFLRTEGFYFVFVLFYMSRLRVAENDFLDLGILWMGLCSL